MNGQTAKRLRKEADIVWDNMSEKEKNTWATRTSRYMQVINPFRRFYRHLKKQYVRAV